VALTKLEREAGLRSHDAEGAMTRVAACDKAKMSSSEITRCFVPHRINRACQLRIWDCPCGTICTAPYRKTNNASRNRLFRSALNRRRFLKYAGVTAAVVGASGLGLDRFMRTSRRVATTTATYTPMMTATSRAVQLSTTSATADMPSAPTHLLATVEDFQRVWQLVQSNQQARSIYLQVKNDADTTLSKSPYRYQLVGEPGLLRVSEHVTDRIYWLGLLYRLTGDIRYRDRAWQELESVSQFPDWQPDSFLSTAEMAHAFAIGYDWFDWNDEQRKILRTAIVEKALKPALESYHKKTQHPFERYGWVLADMNHNQVCNGGIGLAALAVLPDLPDLSREILQNAVESLKLAMRRFAPDGGGRDQTTGTTPHTTIASSLPHCRQHRAQIMASHTCLDSLRPGSSRSTSQALQAPHSTSPIRGLANGLTKYPTRPKCSGWHASFTAQSTLGMFRTTPQSMMCWTCFGSKLTDKIRSLMVCLKTNTSATLRSCFSEAPGTTAMLSLPVSKREITAHRMLTWTSAALCSTRWVGGGHLIWVGITTIFLDTLMNCSVGHTTGCVRKGTTH